MPIKIAMVRSWTHLSVTVAALDFTGPGETQIEADRRLIEERMIQMNTT